MKMKRFWVRFFVRYLIAFLLVFISSAVIYVTALEGLKKEELEKFDTQARQGVTDIENMIERLILLENIVKQNSDFQTILADQGAIENANTMSLLNAKGLMTELCMATDLAYAFIMFERNEAYISNTQCDDNYEEYYNSFIKMESLEYALEDAASAKETFFEISDFNQFVPLEKFAYVDSVKERQLEKPLLYLVKGGNERFGRYVIGFIIDSVELQKMLGGYYYESVDYCVIEFATGRVLLNHETDYADGCDTESYVFINDRNVMGWNIEVRIFISTIRDTLNKTSRLLEAYLVAGFLIVIGMTVVFWRRGYIGVNNVLGEFGEEEDSEEREYSTDRLPVHAPVSKKFKEDEYSIMAGAIKKQRIQGDVWKKSLKEMENQNRILMLSHIITKGIDSRNRKEVLTHYFEEKLEFYCVAIVRPALQNDESREKLILDFVDMLDERMTDAFIHLQIGEVDEVFLISIEPSKESNVDRIEKVFGECVTLLTGKIDGTFHVGISRIGRGVENIYQRYEQTRQVVQSLAVYENISQVRVFSYDDIAAAENLVNIDFLNRFNSNILCGKREEALEAVEKIHSSFVRNPMQFELQKEQIYYSVRNVFFNIFLYFGKVQEVDQVLPKYQMGMTMEDMCAAFRKGILDICDYVDNRKKSIDDELRGRVIQYLEEHYTDPGMSAYYASMELGISEKRLTAILKEETGKSFADYLLDVRLKYAKEYLKTSDYSNEKIAELTGFSAANTFYRNFNKKTGMTPKAYKEYVVR